MVDAGPCSMPALPTTGESLSSCSQPVQMLIKLTSTAVRRSYRRPEREASRSSKCSSLLAQASARSSTTHALR